MGTNLSAVSLAPALEEELSKPVVAINTATYWHALRNAAKDSNRAVAETIVAEGVARLNSQSGVDRIVASCVHLSRLLVCQACLVSTSSSRASADYLAAIDRFGYCDVCESS